MAKKQRRPQKPKERWHKMLFEKDTPYKQKICRNKTKYKRNEKFKKDLTEYD